MNPAIHDELRRECEKIPENEVRTFPVKLCPIAALSQAAHDLGLVTETHVATQSHMRLLLQALGQTSTLSEKDQNGDFEILRSLGTSMLNNFHEGAVQLMRGNGQRGAASSEESEDLSEDSLMSIANNLNSGMFSVRALRRYQLDMDLVQWETRPWMLLNFFVACRDLSTTWNPFDKKKVALAVTKSDGMLIKEGLCTIVGNLVNLGLQSGAMTPEKAQQWASLSDDGLKANLHIDPLCTEVVEYMITSADGSETGHLGFHGNAVPMNAASYIREVMKYLPFHACFACVLQAHEDGQNMAYAAELCKIHYSDCSKQFLRNRDFSCALHGNEPRHWATRRCDRCTNLDLECYSIFILSHVQDACGVNGSAIRRQNEVLERAFEASRTPPSDRTSDLDEPALDGFSESGDSDKSGDSDESDDSDESNDSDADSPDEGDSKTDDAPNEPDATTEEACEIELISDAIHDAKNIRNGSKNYWINIFGNLSGHRILQVRFHDQDKGARDRIRGSISRSAVVARNKYSAEDARDTVEECVQKSLLSDDERANREAHILCFLAPEPYQNPKLNSSYSTRAPRGSAWHPKSGFLFYVDCFLGQLRILKAMHIPAPNKLVIGGLIEPRDICISDKKNCYIACGGGDTCTNGSLLFLDVSSVVAVKKKKDTPPLCLITVSIEPDAQFGCLLRDPVALSCAPDTSDLFVADGSQQAVIIVSLYSSSNGVAKKIAAFDSPPGGVAVISKEVFVTAGDSVFILQDDHGVWSKVLACSINGSRLRGISAAWHGPEFTTARLRYDPELTVADEASKKIYRLYLGPAKKWLTMHVAGSGGESQEIKRGGTAACIPLETPFYLCCIGRSVVISDTKAGIIYLLTDIYRFVSEYMPKVRKVWDICGFSINPEGHSCNLISAHADASLVASYFDELEAYVHNLTGNSVRSIQGNAGCFSRSLRDLSRVRRCSFLRQMDLLARIETPMDVFLAVDTSAQTTLAVETFFTFMRPAEMPMIYFGLYCQRRITCISEAEKYHNGNCGFSYARSRGKMDHYAEDQGSLSVETIYGPPRKPKPPHLSQLESEERRRGLKYLRDAAEALKGTRQTRITDLGRERAGSML